MHISPEWLVIVAGLEKATFLQKKAASGEVKLGNLHVMTLEDESTHQLDAANPVKPPAEIGERKTYYEQSNLQQAKQNRFLEQVAVNAQELFRIHAFKSVALIAEAKALGILRQEMGGIIQAATFVEIAGEYTGKSITDLESILAAYPDQLQYQSSRTK